MNAGRKNSSLTPKKSTKPASSDACRLWGLNSKISVGDFSGKNKYLSTENLFTIPERAGDDKIPLVDLWKYVSVLDPQYRKCSREWETASFCSHYNINPPRQEADRRSKSKHSPENSFVSATKWWMSLSITRVANALLCSDELYCPSDQSGVAVATLSS